MARLYDRVIRDADMQGEEIAGTTVIAADNVADYWWGNADAEGGWSYGDFPNIAPPLDEVFIETRMPDGEIYPSWDRGWPQRWGALFTWITREEAEEYGAEISPHFSFWFDRGGWEWACGASMVFWHRAHGFERVPLVISVPVAADGGIALADDEGLYCHPHKSMGHSQARERTRFVLPLLLAISFMHCKNVESREVVPPKPLSKKWEKKHGRPKVTYRVLDIDPMKKTLESEGGASETGLKKALHICRGHFAHYPEGLFNRGEPETVWKPQHVRGSAEAGAVVKDYNVKSP